MSGIVEWYTDIMYNKNDPRTKDWFLISGPGPIIMIVVTYIYFSLSAGQRYMRDRKPYDLRHIMTLYNFVQILLSAYLVYEGSMAGWLRDYKFVCEPVDRTSPMGLRMANAVHMYFICKLIELLDTFFFVLRKKNRQITFLHMYHHAIMPICAWVGVRFHPGGHMTLLGLINSFIHIFMYTYYMLSAFGPQIQKYLWWKRYLTLMQIIQFCIILVQNIQSFMTCKTISPILSFLVIVNSILFIYLFGSFYVRNYIVKNRESKTTTSTIPTTMTTTMTMNGIEKHSTNTTCNGIIKSKPE